MQAKLQWFDASSGEGAVIVLEDNSIQYLHFSCIAGVACSPT